jgi:hypothetical protein
MTVVLPGVGVGIGVGVGVGVGAAGGVVVFCEREAVEPPPHDTRVKIARIKAA